MYRIGLNLDDMDNNAFYCPASNVRLTRMNPVGNFKEITPSVLRGLKGGTLIDVDKKIDKKIYLSKSQLELDEINNATISTIFTPMFSAESEAALFCSNPLSSIILFSCSIKRYSANVTKRGIIHIIRRLITM